MYGSLQTEDDRPEKHVTLESIQLDGVEPFHYLGDKICPGGACVLATILQTGAVCGKFRELLSLLTSTTISLVRHGKLDDSCVMLANVGLCREKCNAFWITNKQCYAECQR